MNSHVVMRFLKIKVGFEDGLNNNVWPHSEEETIRIPLPQHFQQQRQALMHRLDARTLQEETCQGMVMVAC
jgi:hypothetical protein